MPDPAAPTYRFGAFELDFDRAELRRDGARVELQRKPLQLLLYLAQHRDRVVSNRDLLDQVWADVTVSENALTSAVRDVRRALGDEGRSPRFIQNLRGHGYRFIAEVEDVPRSVVGPPRRYRRHLIAVGVLLGAAVALALGFYFRPGRPVSALTGPSLTAIAVLPFENLSGDPEQEYFVDGMTEDLITRLSSSQFLQVIARNSSFVYKGRAVDVKQVSRELGVRYIVEGSFRKTGDRVRISAQLIDATTGHHVWASTYDRELHDVFALQDEISQTIAVSIRPEVVATEQERVMRRNPQSLDAYENVLRGRCRGPGLVSHDNEAVGRSDRGL